MQFKLLLLLLWALLVSITLSIPQTRMFVPDQEGVLSPKAIAQAANSSSPADLIQVRYSVRWFDPTLGLFGATMNITFVNAELFSQKWYLRVHMADLATSVQEYWGTWNTTRLGKGWYQITPGAAQTDLGDLRLDTTNTVYYSFNGNWTSTNGDWNTTRMAVDAMDFQYWPNDELTKEPAVRHLAPPEEFANMPTPFATPAEPFGNFVRVGKQSTKYPEMQMSYSTIVKAIAGPTSNFFGMNICLPLLGFFIGLILVGTVNRLRWRRRFRRQFLERARLRGENLAKAAASGGGGGRVMDHATAPSLMSGPGLRDVKAPIHTATAAAAVISMPRPEEQDSGGAIGQVVSYYKRGTTVLEPGLQYRMSVYQQAAQHHQDVPLPPMPRFLHEGTGSPRLTTFDHTTTYLRNPRVPSPSPAYEPPARAVGSLPGYEEHESNNELHRVTRHS